MNANSKNGHYLYEENSKDDDNCQSTINGKPTEFHSLPFLQKPLFIARNITVEPVVFFLGITTTMSIIITPSFLVEKVCLSTLSYSDETCRNLSANMTLEQHSQNLAANLNMIKIIIETIPAVIFTLFLGPWSDRFGRKKTIAFPAAGGCISMGLLIIIAYFQREIPPEVVLVAALAQSLAGGALGIVSIGGSYISDITSLENRTTRLTILQVAFMAATPIGSGLCGVIFEYLGGYVVVFVVAFILNLSALVYIIFAVKETVIISPEDKNNNQFLAFFNLRNLQSNYKTLKKRREKNQHIHLWLVLAISFSYMFIAMGEVSITFLYLRWRYSMSEMTFSILFTIILVVDSIGLALLPFFTYVCKIPANVLGIISGISRIIISLIYGLSTETWMIFAGCSLVIVFDIYMPVTRSIMSQCVSPQEQGKVFSILAALEASAPAIGSILCVQVYNKTLTILPGAVFLMTATIALFPLAMMCYLTVDRRRYDWKNVDTEMKTTATT